MTSTATHVGSSFVPKVTSMVGAEALRLMNRFPHRDRPSTWEATAVTREEVLERLTRPPLRAVEPSAQANRMFGARLLLDWLMTFPGETWQQRWQKSPAHGQHIASQGWRDAFAAWARPEGRVSRRETLLVGLLALLCADAVRPDPEFLIGSRSRHLRPALETTRDPEGFARLRASLPTNISAANISSGLKTIAEIMACRGGAIEDIVVGDLLLWQRKNPSNSNGRIQLAYTWLRDLGLFPADAPHTLFRISNRTGQLTPADLVDRYELQCRPIRDLLVAYLSHRSVGLDFTTLQALTISLALRFWGDLERHHPGIDSLRLPAEVITAWKVRLATKTFRVPRFSKCADGRPIHAWDAKGTRRSFAGEERSAFWGWAAIEILRHTGIRIEELLELGHHSIVSYKLPITGQTVPLLQIAPSKTDQERLVLVTPELADVLSTVVSRVRGSDGRVPVVRSYDHYERVWNPPMPLLFQDRSGGYLRPLSRATIRRGLDVTLLASGLTDSAGDPLIFQPHDFRRIFITDSILKGLPPHIAQVIAGHDHIETTMGYAAIYPTDAIEAHRAFIARRRALRPADEYRTVTPEEWGEFLGHFERRKLALGDCGRSYGTDCAHEHACVRCPALIVHATERPRLVEIRDNLLTRILEAEREGWLGEIEGLQSSLTHAEEKLAQLDAQISRKQESVDLGIPTFREIVARSTAAATPPGPA
ncbi:site-specific integrase [Streptomyces iakyrus]|uniref:site-specific integrase n=1 Tax=Streptomyces iakyrus TaxID=68219 RepID=UPI00339E6329